jgi:hypothetical protein
VGFCSLLRGIEELSVLAAAAAAYQRTRRRGQSQEVRILVLA